MVRLQKRLLVGGLGANTTPPLCWRLIGLSNRLCSVLACDNAGLEKITRKSPGFNVWTHTQMHHLESVFQEWATGHWKCKTLVCGTAKGLLIIADKPCYKALGLIPPTLTETPQTTRGKASFLDLCCKSELSVTAWLCIWFLLTMRDTKSR